MQYTKLVGLIFTALIRMVTATPVIGNASPFNTSKQLDGQDWIPIPVDCDIRTGIHGPGQGPCVRECDKYKRSCLSGCNAHGCTKNCNEHTLPGSCVNSRCLMRPELGWHNGFGQCNFAC